MAKIFRRLGLMDCVRHFILGFCVICSCMLTLGGGLAEEIFAQQNQGNSSPPKQAMNAVQTQETGSADNDTAPLFWLGLILLGILLLAVLQAYKSRRAALLVSQEVLQQFQKERQQLLQKIALLDDQYADGAIEESVYISARKHHKQQIVELTLLCKSRS